MLELINNFDGNLFLFFNRDIANPFFDLIFPFITELKFWVIPGIIAIAIFIKLEHKKALLVLGLAVIAVLLSDSIAYRILKPLFGRIRPCNPSALIEGGRFLLGYNTSYAFPSNHASNMFALATLFTCFYRKRTAYFFGFAAIIGFSRIYVGVHYPIDVVGGAVLGVIIGWGVYEGYIFTIRIRHKFQPTDKKAR
ncbi:MAG: phosphatase PAP2 family protein [Candidatus Cloacimonetes bacterium]|nr:phosphatase PAP2 family protein [Candidatus Cloacimonadota bacterium]